MNQEKKRAVQSFEKKFDFGGNGKMLHTCNSLSGEYSTRRGKRFMYIKRAQGYRNIFYVFRNRLKSQFYYTIKFKGSNILLIREQTVLERGEPVNVFTFAMIHGIRGEDLPKYVTKKEVLLKMPYKKWPEFLQMYIELTPDLR